MSPSRQASTSDISLLVHVEPVLSWRESRDWSRDVHLAIIYGGERDVSMDVLAAWAGQEHYGAWVGLVLKIYALFLSVILYAWHYITNCIIYKYVTTLILD